MKKIYLLITIIAIFYGCSSKEVIVPVEIKVTIIENSETEETVPIKVKKVPLYEKNIKYKGQLPLTDYVFTRRPSNIRKKPDVKSPRIGLTTSNKKIRVIRKVNGRPVGHNKIWYKVKYNGKIGYLHSSVAVRRHFDLKKMAKKVRNLDVFLWNARMDGKSIERIVAYKPETKEEVDTVKDGYGNRGEQSVVGDYINNSGKERFRYLQDGRIVAVEEREEEKIKIKIPDSSMEYTINEGDTRKLNLSGGINKVILVDIENQIEAAFEKEDDIWKLVGYSLITSGKDDGEHAYDTPKGYFIVQNTLTYILFSFKEKVLLEDAIKREEKRRVEYEKKQDERIKNIEKSRKMSREERLMAMNGETLGNSKGENDRDKLVIKPFVPKYTEEDYEEVTKYSRANYGIRFSGGGYLHGIPLRDETVEKLMEEGGEEAVIKRKKADEIRLGTFKASHKCVRNVEEFQEFLYYDFMGYERGKTNKRWKLPKEKIAVIVF